MKNPPRLRWWSLGSVTLWFGSILLLGLGARSLPAQTTYQTSASDFTSAIMANNFPVTSPPKYNAVEFAASGGDTLFVDQNISIQSGGVTSIFTSMTWTNAGPTRVSSQLLGCDEFTTPVNDRRLAIRNLTLNNVALDTANVGLRFQPASGTSSLTLNNSSITGEEAPHLYAPVDFSLNVSGNSLISRWTGRLSSVTTLTVASGGTLELRNCGKLRGVSPQNDSLFFGQPGNTANFDNATLLTNYSYVTFGRLVDSQLGNPSTMTFANNSTLELRGSDSRLDTGILNMQDSRLNLDFNTILNVGSTLEFDHSQAVIKDGGLITVPTVRAKGDSTITFTDYQPQIGIKADTLALVPGATLTLKSTGRETGEIVIAKEVVFPSGPGSATFAMNGDTILTLSQGAKMVLNPTAIFSTEKNAIVNLDESTMTIAAGATFTNAGQLEVREKGLVKISSGPVTIGGGGEILLKGELSLVNAKTPGSTTLTTTNNVDLTDTAQLSLAINPAGGTSDRLVVGGNLSLTPGAILNLSLTQDVHLAPNTKFLLIDHTARLTSGFQGRPNGELFGLGLNIYRLLYNDRNALAAGGFGVSLTAIGEIYKSYWGVNRGGNWVTDPNWGTLGKNIGVAPGMNGGLSRWDTATFDTRGLKSGLGQVKLATDAVLSKIFFSNAAASYRIAGPGSITLRAGNANPTLTNAAGAHTLAVAMKFRDSVAVAVASGAKLTLGGPITGPGGLIKTGGGLVVLSGNSAYGGPTTLRAGTMQVSGTQAGNGALNVTGGRYQLLGRATGNGPVTLRGGTMEIRGTQAGNGALDVTGGRYELLGLSTGDGPVTLRGGTMEIRGTQAGNGALTVAGGRYELLGQFTGGGPITQNGGTFLLNGGHTGGAAFTVNGGLLTGTGRSTSRVTVNAGGTIRPGAGFTPGTLSVGSLRLHDGSNFQSLIASSTNTGKIAATGAVVVGGQLTAIPVGGWRLNYGDRYEVLTAGQGISGRFGRIETPVGYRGRFVVEKAGTIGVLLFAPPNYETMAATANQRSIARALNPFITAARGDQQVVSTALDRLPANQYQNAFDQISPVFYQSLATIAFNQANAQNNALVERAYNLRLGGAGFSMSGFAENSPVLSGQGDKDTGAIVPGSRGNKRWGMFVDGNGIFARANSANMLPTYNVEGGGVTMGLTYAWNENFTTGVYAGYQGTRANYPDGSRLTNDSVRFGLMGTYGARDGRGFYADFLVGGGYNDYAASRKIQFGSINRTAQSSPGGWELDSLLAAGYNFGRGNWNFGPVTSLQYTYFGMPAFSETGAGSLNLQGLDWNTSSLIYNLGCNLAYTWQVTRDILVIPQINLAWQHEFLQSPYDITGTLGGQNISNGSATPLRDTLYTGVGVTVRFGDRWNASFFYNAAAGNRDLTSQNIFCSAGVRF